MNRIELLRYFPPIQYDWLMLFFIDFCYVDRGLGAG